MPHKGLLALLKKYSWVLIAILGLMSQPVLGDASEGQGSEVSVTQFGAVPDDNRNDAAALVQAADYARAHPGTLLRFPAGTYDLRDEAAVRLMDDVLAGKFGRNPEPNIFKPYFPYAKGLDLQGVTGLTIEARGARLLFDGWGEPVSLIGARDVVIRGLVIDYKRRPWSGGRVTAVGKDWFEATIDAGTSLTPLAAIARIEFWDKASNRMIAEAYPRKVEAIGSGRLRISASPLPTRIVGSELGLIHTYHFRPAILVQESDNVVLDGVTIHAQPGMGVVAHRCNNLTMRGLRVVPGPGAHFSTNTDATHLTSCTGLIRIENSQFEGHGDDAVNVHNYYWTVAKGTAGRYFLSIPVTTHAAVLSHPDAGDRLELVRAATLEPIGTVTVRSVKPDRAKMRAEVELSGEMPVDLGAVLLADVTHLPKLEIVGNAFLSHRARGVLVKTRNVLIERNLFLANTGTGVHVAAEGGWYEGVPSANVTIRENRFIANGFGDGTMHGASAIAVNIDAKESALKPLHQGLLIEGNIIDGGGARRCIYISQVKGVIVRFNEFSHCAEALTIESSDEVVVEHNHTSVADSVSP